MNNLFKRTFSALAMVTLVSGLFSCGNDTNTPAKPGKPIEVEPITDVEKAVEYFEVGSPLKRLPQTKVDLENTQFDGFMGPINREKWAVGHGFWGHDNGGVSAKNVRVTDDGQLVLKAHGDYYAGDVKGIGERTDGTRTGAAIISKFFCGPGHYEIKMKVTPRIGCCTAFWTYAYKANPEGGPGLNSELDIELPGGGDVGDVSLEKCCNTNWYKENMNDTGQFDTKDFGDSVANNDGEWHTYGFDWYSDPAIIVYHFDGKITKTSIVNLPTLMARLNIGVWFPVGWTGIPEFDEDVMLVDSVLYEPFIGQTAEEYYCDLGHGANTETMYNDDPITLAPINKIANGNFEYFSKIDDTLTQEQKNIAVSSKGWQFLKRRSAGFDKNTPLETIAYIHSGEGVDGSNAAFIKDNGVIRQTIDSAFEGYRYDLSFMGKAKLPDGNSRISIQYLEKGDKKLGDPVVIEVKNTEEFEKFTTELVCPAKTRSIRIEGRTEAGNELLIDDVELYFRSSK